MQDYRHFFLPNTGDSERYTATGGGSGKFRTPPRDSRETHGRSLLEQLEQVQEQAATLEDEPATAGLHFVPVSFQGELNGPEGAASGLKLESLENKDGSIRVVNVKEDGDHQVAVVAIEHGKFEHFAKRFKDYAGEPRDSGVPYHRDLVESISELRLAVLQDYYTDVDGELPPQEQEIWWEIWLDLSSNSKAEQEFRDLVQQHPIELSGHSVGFPETAVVLARASLDSFSKVIGLLNYLAEFRRAKLVATKFVDLRPKEQAQLVERLVARITFAGPTAPAVWLLDTGVNRGHPLISGTLAEDETQSWNPEWNSADLNGHGTEIAGIAQFGDTLPVLLSNEEQVELVHRLESVKILPDSGANDPPDYGVITLGSMAKAELQNPDRERVFCLSTTADDRDAWRPTLWSSSIDQAASSTADGRRLIFISAGNLRNEPGKRYPDDNHIASIQDPAQSWNAVTVGAFTDRAWIDSDELKDWEIIAPKGRLSPASTTTLSWSQQEWPIKPDIVLEGGNYVKDPSGFVSATDDLSLLTTQLSPDGALLGTTRDTSPATAQAARMAAIVQAHYPEFWPESVRGLLVHTAEWTKEMEAEFPQEKRKSGKGYKKIPAARLRCYGWGVPNLQRAMRSARNVATMIIQDELQPFAKPGKGAVVTEEMKVHSLPLPVELLRDIAEESVRMRVTLSYFIDPSPGRKGWTVKHRYASHGLRFDVKRPTESLEEFKKHISREYWDGSIEQPEKKKRPAKRDKERRNWLIGDYAQNRGSLHSDWWVGTAAQLASSEFIAVFPVTGWWRERPQLEGYLNSARYSLIATIETNREDIELYNAVAATIETSVAAAADVVASEE